MPLKGRNLVIGSYQRMRMQQRGIVESDVRKVATQPDLELSAKPNAKTGRPRAKWVGKAKDRQICLVVEEYATIVVLVTVH